MPLQYNLIEVSLKELVQICFLYCTYCFYSESLLYPLILHLQINFSDSLSFIFLSMYKRCLCLNMVGNIHFCPPCHFLWPHWGVHTQEIHATSLETMLHLRVAHRMHLALPYHSSPYKTPWSGSCVVHSLWRSQLQGSFVRIHWVTLWNWWRRRRTT